MKKLETLKKMNALLRRTRNNNRAEMYHGIKFSDLKDILVFIVNNYDKSVEYINNFIRSRLDLSLEEEEEEVPPPLDYERLSVRIGDHEETIELDSTRTRCGRSSRTY
jgi:hypothetical protein